MPDTTDSDFFFSKDVYIDDDVPDSNLNNQGFVKWGESGGKEGTATRRPILHADISSVASDRPIRNGKLHLYMEIINYVDASDTGANACDSRRCGEDGWVETQATWNNKATGTAWAQAGGTPTGPYCHTQNGPAEGGTPKWWTDFEAGTYAAFAKKGNGGIFDFLGILNAGLEERDLQFDDDETGGANRPFLRVTHETKGRQVSM